MLRLGARDFFHVAPGCRSMLEGAPGRGVEAITCQSNHRMFYNQLVRCSAADQVNVPVRDWLQVLA